MIDHLLGRPSVSWKRTQVILVLLFWAWRLKAGDPRGPTGLKRYNDILKRFTPWQVTVALFTCLYGIRHWDILVGLAAPEPLARLYSRGFYRATWINTALDAGFATASVIPFKWLRDLASVVFSGYYLIYANEADEKLRRFRAVPTVEVLRITWEKTSNPIIQLVTRPNRPQISIKRKYIFPRPPGSKYTKPVTCWLYFSRPDLDLVRSKNLILDIPGGGFIAMSPLHHEERLTRWTIKTGLPILSVDYCKAPEYPFPYAIHECMDVYRLIQESKGRVIGMGRDTVDVVLTGDSAGANISAAMITSILESPSESPFHSLPLPVGVIWLYAALDFNFTSWMSPENLRVLRRDKSSADLPEGIIEAKNHFKHMSPLSVVDDRSKSDDDKAHRKHRRQHSKLRQSFANLPSMVATWKRALTPKVEKCHSDVELKPGGSPIKSEGSESDDEDPQADLDNSPRSMNRKSLGERVLFHEEESPGEDACMDIEDGETKALDVNDIGAEPPAQQSKARSEKKTFGTRLTMTSRTSFFNDRVISPSMMRCMAICYIGPRNAPDLTKDYHISPIFTPMHLLARFPPVYLVCGEKDPFVDDTVLIAGKLREAKRIRKDEALAQNKPRGERRLSMQKKPDPIIEETEADWVQMRIFEGWSHGFAQMLSLLPEVGTALDLTADFILSAFRKHDDKLRKKPPLITAPQQAPSHVQNSPPVSGGADDEDALTFTPRGKQKGDSACLPDSPAPLLRASKQTGSPGRSWSMRSTPPPILRVTRHTSLSTSDNGSGPALTVTNPPVTPRTMVEFNVASAAAIVAPPLVPAPTSDKLPTRREGKILDDHYDLLNRRREEAGYGLPVMHTPEDHYRPLTELSAPSTASFAPRGDGQTQTQYVEEDALFERRMVDATYGLTQGNLEPHHDI